MMLGYLRDYANAITATGYVFAILGLFLALNGHLELGTAAMLWTWFLDHWDGHVARKTKDSRRPGMAVEVKRTERRDRHVGATVQRRRDRQISPERPDIGGHPTGEEDTA